jgi:FkbM family methyltransferase
MLLFDIGANIGKWTLQNLNNNRIISVEASPKTYRDLVQNVAGKNVIPLNYAVSNTPSETVKFYESQHSTLSSLDRRWLEDPRSRFGGNFSTIPCTEIIVNAISLDTLIARYGVPDLLKVDVEGAENSVIKSLTQKAKLLCFEWASEWNPETFECIDHLVSIGYTRFHVQNEDGYTYRPYRFEHDANSLKAHLSTTVAKHHWGMIWCMFD